VPRRPVDQALRERSRILSDLRSGSKHLVFRIRAFASRQHSAYGGLGGNDVQGDEVSKPRTPVVTVTGGARGRYEEGNLKDDASSSLAHRRKVLRSAPSAHVAIVPRPFYACKSVERECKRWLRSHACVQAPAPTKRRSPARHRSTVHDASQDAPTDECQMAWLPAVHRAPHPVFACEHGTTLKRRRATARVQRGGQGRRPRAGEDQELVGRARASFFVAEVAVLEPRSLRNAITRSRR